MSPHRQPGDRIGDWVVSARLGSGAFGAVYRCHHPDRPGDVVAIKLLLNTEHRYAMRSFRREAQVLKGLRNPHIVEFREASLDADPPFLVMEYIEGASLQTLLTAPDSPPPEPLWLLDILEKMAGALLVLHEQDPPLIHRDIKPDNIMIRGGRTPKLVDFGLTAAPGMTATGTHEYVPMEVLDAVEGDRTANLRLEDPSHPSWDIFSLGLTFYKALTGMRAVTTRQKLEWASFDPGPTTPTILGDLVCEMTARDAGNRPTARKIYERIQSWRETTLRPQPLPIPTPPEPLPQPPPSMAHAWFQPSTPTPTPTPSTSARRRGLWLGAAMAAGMMAALLALGSVLTIGWLTARRPVAVRLDGPAEIIGTFRADTQTLSLAGGVTKHVRLPAGPWQARLGWRACLTHGQTPGFAACCVEEDHQGAVTRGLGALVLPLQPASLPVCSLLAPDVPLIRVSGDGLLTPLMVMTTEVSQALYRQHFPLPPCDKSGVSALLDPHTAGDSLPVVCVSVEDAARFANALTRQAPGLGEPAVAYFADARLTVPITDDWTGGTPYWKTDALGYRLPSEPEWTALAKADPAASSTDARNPDAPCASANRADQDFDRLFLEPSALRKVLPLATRADWTLGCSDGHAGPAPVGSFPAGARGLHDLSGNVWELVWSPTILQGQARLRGGDWILPHTQTAPDQHLEIPVDARIHNAGLRLVRSLPEGT